MFWSIFWPPRGCAGSRGFEAGRPGCSPPVQPLGAGREVPRAGGRPSCGTCPETRGLERVMRRQIHGFDTTIPRLLRNAAWVTARVPGGCGCFYLFYRGDRWAERTDGRVGKDPLGRAHCAESWRGSEFVRGRDLAHALRAARGRCPSGGCPSKGPAGSSSRTRPASSTQV
jgi:hypothetical protein